MEDKDDKVNKVRKILSGSNLGKIGKNPDNVVNIAFGHGDGNVVGNNNIIRVTKTEKVYRPNIIDPLGGELSPHQKQRLKDLVDGIVRVSRDAGRPTNHSAVWKRFQRNFDINTYHALPVVSYERAKKYLRMLYGRAKKQEL